MDIKSITIYTTAGTPIKFNVSSMKKHKSIASHRIFLAKQINHNFTVSGPSGRIVGKKNDYVVIEKLTSVIFVESPKLFDRVYTFVK